MALNREVDRNPNQTMAAQDRQLAMSKMGKNVGRHKAAGIIPQEAGWSDSTPIRDHTDMHMAQPGDVMLAGGHYQTVDHVEHFAPGEHPHSPIYNHMHATAITTAGGAQRWGGHSGNGGANQDLQRDWPGKKAR
jgi:hypothetical protein